jgi:hypothetical protein
MKAEYAGYAGVCSSLKKKSVPSQFAGVTSPIYPFGKLFSFL